MHVSSPAAPTAPTPDRITRRIAFCGYFLLLFLFTTPIFAFSTPLKGTPLNDGYYALYNLDFNAAHAHFGQWMTEHPDDCLGSASDAAAYIFNEFNILGVLDIELFADDNRFTSRTRPPIDPALKQGFNNRIDQSNRLADKYSELASKYAKQALAANPTLYDANLAVGIENYMLSLKAAPIRWFLGMAGAGTNKAEGVRLLKLTAEQGHYLAPFARLMLAVGELRDGRTQPGKQILIGLSQEFPQNTLYQRQIARLH